MLSKELRVTHSFSARVLMLLDLSLVAALSHLFMFVWMNFSRARFIERIAGCVMKALLAALRWSAGTAEEVSFWRASEPS